MKIVHIFVISFFTTSIFIGCKDNPDSNKNENVVDVFVYLSPRNIDNGFYNNKIYQYNLDSIDRYEVNPEFGYNTLEDSICVYRFKRMKISSTEYKSFTKKLRPIATMEKDQLDYPSILVIFKNQQINDTLSIGSDLIMGLNKKGYELEDSTYKFLLKLMPVQMRENWEGNLPPFPSKSNDDAWDDMLKK